MQCWGSEHSYMYYVIHAFMVGSQVYTSFPGKLDGAWERGYNHYTTSHV